MKLPNRRGFIKSASITALATSIPAAAGAAVIADEGDTPILRLFRQWCETDRYACEVESEDEVDVALDLMAEIENAMFSKPSTGVADLAAKIVAFTHNGDHEMGCEGQGAPIWAEMRALTGAPQGRAV